MKKIWRWLFDRKSKKYGAIISDNCNDIAKTINDSLIIIKENQLIREAEISLRNYSSISTKYNVIEFNEKYINTLPVNDQHQIRSMKEYINLKQNNVKQTKLDSTKIYWLDKEETVKVKLIKIDIPHGFESIKYTLRVIHGGFGDIVYMDSNLPKTIHEVVESKQWQFTTPIAMKCTEEQFDGIKDKLVEMGYVLRSITFGEKYRYLCTGYASCDKFVTDLGRSSLYFMQANPIVFETFNTDLFLALAAMTDKEDGIKGEWWRYCDGSFKIQEYNVRHSVINFGWRKATAKEIIEHFEKKEFVLPENYMVRVNTGVEYLDVLNYARTLNELIDDCHSLIPYKYPYYIGIQKNGEWSYDCRYRPEVDGTEITFDQFKKYVLKETAFSLPEKWCVKVTEENRQDLKLHFCNAIVGCWVLYNGNYNQFTGLPSGCTEITFEQFEKYVDKKTLKHSLAKETRQSCQSHFLTANTFTYNRESNFGLLSGIRTYPNYFGGTVHMSSVPTEPKTVIPIPPTKQATLFDDRVEITDWKPKYGDVVFIATILNTGEFTTYKDLYMGNSIQTMAFKNGFIKHTESEAKQLVEKLKKAML